MANFSKKTPSIVLYFAYSFPFLKYSGSHLPTPLQRTKGSCFPFIYSTQRKQLDTRKTPLLCFLIQLTKYRLGYCGVSYCPAGRPYHLGRILFLHSGRRTATSCPNKNGSQPRNYEQTMALPESFITYDQWESIECYVKSPVGSGGQHYDEGQSFVL